MCVETLTGVLFWSSDLLGKPFRASCFPFETLSGSLLLLLLLQIPQVAHSTGNAAAGLDMNAGVVGDMAALGIMESYKSKTSSLSAAAEAAEQVGWDFNMKLN